MDKNTFKFLAENNLEPEKVIINLGEEGGTHWTAYKKINNKTLEYYDPFGVNPPFQIKGKETYYNPYVIQKEKDSNCGAHCIAYLLNYY